MESHEPLLFSLLLLTIFIPISLAICLPKKHSLPPFAAPPFIFTSTAPSPLAYAPDEDSPFPDLYSPSSSPANPPAADDDFPFSDYSSLPSPASAPSTPDHDSLFPPDYSPFSSPAYAPAPNYSPLSSPANAPEIVSDFLFSPDSAPSVNPIDVNPGLDKICKSTDYYEICVQLISPLLNGKTDVISIFKLAVKVAADGTKQAIASADKLAQDKGNSPQLSSIIGDCKDSYTDSLENFSETLSALPAKDVGTMSSMLSASITDFGDCDDFLTGYNKSPLLDYNTKLVKMTSNCLAIASLIK